MNLHTSARYALFVMGHFGAHPQGWTFTSKEIAEEYNLPGVCLRAVMNQLMDAGFLKSQRGRYGGFFLAKPASEISLLEIIEAVYGSDHGFYELPERAKNRSFGKKLDKIHIEITNYAIAILKKAKLSDMVK